MKTATCADCGRRIVYKAQRFVWVHQQPGADHAPRVQEAK